MIKEHMYSDEVKSIRVNTTPMSSNRYDRKAIIITDDGEYTRTLRINELVAEPSEDDTFVFVDLATQYDPFKISLQ